MGNDLFETIRQHYNGIDLDRLYKWCEVAYQKAAHDEGINLRFGLYIELTEKQVKEDKMTPNMLANKIKYNNGYLQSVAMIYGEIAEKEEQIAADLETLSKCRDKTPDLEKLERVLKRLHLRCNEYHEKAEFMPQYAVKRPTMQAATDTAAALPDILKSDKVKRAFEIAKERGYISKVGNHYKWNLSSKVLLAYFLGRLLGDKVEYDTVARKYRWLQSEILPTKTIEALFDCKNVGQSRYNNKLNNGFVPKGAALIDDIINKL